MSSALRNRILEIQNHLATGAMPPEKAREHLLSLTALYGNVMAAIQVLERDYHLILLGCMEGKTPKNKAEIQAQVTPQYQAFREMDDIGKLVVLTTQALKKYIDSQIEEMRMTPRLEQRSRV